MLIDKLHLETYQVFVLCLDILLIGDTYKILFFFSLRFNDFQFNKFLLYGNYGVYIYIYYMNKRGLNENFDILKFIGCSWLNITVTSVTGKYLLACTCFVIPLYTYRCIMSFLY